MYEKYLADDDFKDMVLKNRDKYRNIKAMYYDMLEKNPVLSEIRYNTFVFVVYTIIGDLCRKK